MTGKRTLILTETKGLEDIYRDEFKSVGLVDIRGASNYACPALMKGGEYDYLNEPNKKPTADNGPCRHGMPCALKDNGCPWFDQLRAVADAPVVSSNYANWLSVSKTTRDGEESLGKFDVLILDECDKAPNQVSNALTVELPLHELEKFFGSRLPSIPTQTRMATAKLLGKGSCGSVDDLRGWSNWVNSLGETAAQALNGATEELKSAKQSGVLHRELLTDIRYLRRLHKDLLLLRGVHKPENWVADVIQLGRGRQVATFQPVWPGPYCEQYLFRGVKKIIGMSATIHPYMVKKLGLEDGEFDFWEFESSFPVENRPIYYFPVAFMRYDMPESEKRRVVHATDQIAKAYKTEKGIVHTRSYDRARHYQQHSKLGSRLRLHTTSTTARTVQEFKDSPDPLVLVSPSVGTGWSFDDDWARWQVLFKMGWPDRRSKLMKRRCDEDKKYPHVLAMDEVVQTVGRIVRSATDFGRSFLLDRAFGGWYESNGKQYAPRWFRDAVVEVRRIPR